MARAIPEDHPLRHLFREATSWAFAQAAFDEPDARDEQVRGYLSEDVLAKFVHIDNLYKIRSARGRPLEDIAEMLMEGTGTSRHMIARLELKRHIGDYALFITGLFPESLARLRRRPASPDSLLMRLGRLFVAFDDPADYYQAQGRQAYDEAAAIGRNVGISEAFVFAKLADHFRGYVQALGLVRTYLDTRPLFDEVRRLIV
jgi:hypothetical protein